MDHNGIEREDFFCKNLDVHTHILRNYCTELTIVAVGKLRTIIFFLYPYEYLSYWLKIISSESMRHPKYTFYHWD